MGKIKNTIIENKEKFIKLLFVLLIIITLVFIFVFLSKKENDYQKEEDIFTSLFVESEEENEEYDSELDHDSDKENKTTMNFAEEEIIMVDLKGAVVSPGVYEMKNNQRVIDCINQAGGFLKEAEQRSINLAERIKDQMVIYIPLKGEELTINNHLFESTDNNIQRNNEIDKIDLNQANMEELKSLKGIGDVKAENIINYRETNGFFNSIDEIKNISGIGEATFDKLKEEITVKP